MGLNAKWIWGSQIAGTENTALCFRRNFSADGNGRVKVKISADTRYILYINGREIGRGPVRSTRERWFYDEYDISGDITAGSNLFAARVWDYGWSTYQTIANKGGLVFEIMKDGETIAASDENCLCTQDTGLVSKTVKRNVNLGFMEHYDARNFNFDWMKQGFSDSSWKQAVVIDDNWSELTKRPIKYFDNHPVRPEKIMAVKAVTPGRHVVSVNTRESFFPGRRDANATIMTSYVGAIIKSSEDCSRRINGTGCTVILRSMENFMK